MRVPCLPPALSWWRDFGAQFAAAACVTPGRYDDSTPSPTPACDFEDMKRLAESPPIMTCAEYLSADVLTSLWDTMGAALGADLTKANARCSLSFSANLCSRCKSMRSRGLRLLA
ncbi:MAG: hypothetical protein P8Y67_13345 [Alphaproteobacteria bacterium]